MIILCSAILIGVFHQLHESINIFSAPVNILISNMAI
jgi:hypothetical protein